jgi:signal transduction histidine kinase
MADNGLELVISGLLRRLARMQQLLIVSKILNETLDLNTLLRYIIETATDLTQTEAASILLIDQKTGRLRFAASTNIKRSELEDLPVPMENSIAGWILTSGKAMTIGDVQRFPHFYEGIDQHTRFHTRSLLGVPLDVRGRKIGVLEVVNKQDNTLFTEDDIEILTILGSQAAVSIENARLFEQSDAIYDVVHELRTPLTSIIGYSKMLLMADSLPPETGKQFASTIHREAGRLGNMVNDYLDLSRLESGRSRLNMTLIDLVPLIQSAIELISPQAGDRRISIHFDPAPSPCDIVVDPERLRQVLVNLLSNAIKYNREGGDVTVRIERRPDGVNISVQDTGQGIEPEQIDHVFDKFYRGEAQEDQVKGTGLGLSIVKQIVELHHGAIHVESQPDKGSTFVVSLPLETSADIS